MRRDKLDFIVFATGKIKESNGKISYNSIEKSFRASGGSVRRQKGQSIFREIKNIYEKQETKKVNERNIAFEVYSKTNKQKDLQSKIETFNKETAYRKIPDRKVKEIENIIKTGIRYQKPPKNYSLKYNYVIEYKFKKADEIGVDFITIASPKKMSIQEIFESVELIFDTFEGQGKYEYKIVREYAKLVVAYKGKYKREKKEKKERKSTSKDKKKK